MVTDGKQGGQGEAVGPFSTEISQAEMLAANGCHPTPWAMGEEHESKLTITDANGATVIYMRFSCWCNADHYQHPETCFRKLLRSRMEAVCEAANQIPWRRNPCPKK